MVENRQGVKMTNQDSFSERAPNIAASVARHGTVGHLALLVLGTWLLGPVIVEKYRNEPNIRSDITIMQLDDRPVVADKISVNYPNSGSKITWMEDSDGVWQCQKYWENLWSKPSHIVWEIAGFTNCNPPTDKEYRICAKYSIRTATGRNVIFGEAVSFCSEYYDPREDNFNF